MAADKTQEEDGESDDSLTDADTMQTEDSVTGESIGAAAENVDGKTSAADGDNYQHLMQLASNLETHSSSATAADSIS